MTRDNPNNFKNLPPEELAEISRSGGIASGEARRKRKALREELGALLENEKLQERICLAIIQQALEGNTRAFAIIRDTLGERMPEAHIVEAFSSDDIDTREEVFKAALEALNL